MEQNKEMKTKKKALIPVLACVVALAACAFCTIGILINKKNTDKDVSKNKIQVEQNEAGELIAKAEATLRQLLEEDATYTIVISENITVNKPLEVNGTKTLVGDKSIIMNLNTEAKQKVLSVSEGAHLILDGATIDGNGVSSGVEVKDGGKLDCLSGNIVYPMPYGIVTAGTVNVEDITIDRSMHTGIYVETGGELYMKGGQIINCIQTGIATSTKAYAKVSNDAVIQKSSGSLFYNFGTLDITGGTYSDSYSNCIYNKGELNIVSESDKLVEFFNSGRSIISSVAGTTVKIDGLYAHDMAAHVMNLEKDSVADVKNVLVENSGKSSFYTNGSKLTMKDVELKDIKSVGINVTNKSTVELSDITIANGGHRGIINDSSNVTMKNITVDNLVGAGIITIGEKSDTTIENAKISKVGKSGIGITGGTVTAKNIEITDAAGTAIYTTTDKSKTTIDGAKLVNSGKSAIGVSVGNLTAKNVEISGTKNTGVYIQKDAKLTLTDATIKGVNKHGIANYFGTAVVKNVSVEAPTNAGILNQGTLTGEKVTINKSGSRAMSLTDASSTNVKGLVINESKNQSVYIDKVTKAHISDFKVDKSGQSAFRITKSTDVLLKSGEITNANGDGIWVSEDAKMKVQDTVITAPTKYGVEVYGTAEVTAVNVTVNSARAGLVNNGGTIIGNTVVVKDSASRSLNLINKSTTSITGLTVKNAGDQAVYIEDTTKVVLKEIDIDTTKGAAIRVSKSKNVTIKTGTIKNAGSDGVYVCDASKIKVEAVDILDSTGYGLMAYGAELTVNGVDVTKAKAGLVNNGGTVNGNKLSIDTTTSRAMNLISGSTTEITGLTVKHAGDQGVYVENSTVNISKFTVDTSKSAAFSLGKTDEIDETAVETVTLTDGTIKNSGSTGIYVGKTATANLTSVTIENAGQHGIQNAGGKLDGKTLTINQSTNRAVTMSTDSETTIDGLDITGTGNQAVYVDGGKAEIKGFEISSGSEEAAVRVFRTKDVKITDGTINATSYGIAISNEASAIAEDVRIYRMQGNNTELINVFAGAELTLQKESLVDGQGYEGRGVVVEGIFNLNGGTIQNNNATIEGAGIYIKDGGNFVMNNGTISNNVNTKEGAAVYICQGGTFEMNDGYIQHNQTIDNSAGVAVRGSFSLNGGTIKNNVAGKNGAGVMVRSTAIFTMTGGTIKNNASTLNGGGIYIQTSTADVNMTGGTIENNSATSGGGIYINSTKVLHMSNTAITANTAAEKGAGVYVAKGTFALEGGSITNHGTSENPSASEGAGVYVASGAKLSMSGGTISNNHTTGNGAGVATYGTFNMSGTSTIQNNTTTSNGGGVYVGGGTYTLNNGSEQTIYNNQAANGGGVAVAAGTLHTKKGVIVGNVAEQGAGVCVMGGTYELTGVTFKDNSASTRGKDIYLASAITLKKALTTEISISPAEYVEGNEIAVNGEIDDDAFKVSMKYLAVEDYDSNKWLVNDEGKLIKAPLVLQSTGKGYATFEEAVAAVTGEDTIQILQNQTISSTIKVTANVILTSNAAVTLTASDSLSGNMFEVANGGTLTINGAATDKKITLAGKNIMKYGILSEGTLQLTNVVISNATQQGIRIASGTATIQGVEIKDSGAYGLVVKKGTVTVKNTLIDNAGITEKTKNRIGIAAHGGTLTLDNVTVQNFVGNNTYKANHGIDHQGGQLIVTANEEVDGGNKGLYIYNVKGHGIYSTGGSMNISKITIDGNGQTRAGIQLTDNNSSENQVSNATITNCSVQIQLKNVSQLIIGDTTVSTKGTEVFNYDTDGNKQ